LYIYLTALFTGLLLMSNVLGVKLFSIWGFILPAAALVYVVTFLITDVIGELYGKKAARTTIQAGFMTQIAALVFIFITIQLPAAPVFESQAQFEEILGGSFRVIAASLLSYLASQNVDLFIFHRLKAKHGKRKLWLRNNLSKMFSQLIDTMIFITIAFWGTVPGGVLLGMIATQYVFKFIISIIDTPIAYLLVYFGRKRRAAIYADNESA